MSLETMPSGEVLTVVYRSVPRFAYLWNTLAQIDRPVPEKPLA